MCVGYVPKAADSAARKPSPKADGPFDTTMEIWGSGSLSMSSSQSELELLGRKLMHVEDKLDANSAMLPLVLLLERGSSLSCADPQDSPIWQVLASLKSPVVSRSDLICWLGVFGHGGE